MGTSKQPYIDADLLFMPTAAPIVLDSPAWHAWLQTAAPPVLHVHTEYGQLSLRQQVQHRTSYWFALKRYQKQLHKIYVAPTTELSAQRVRRAIHGIAVKLGLQPDQPHLELKLLGEPRCTCGEDEIQLPSKAWLLLAAAALAPQPLTREALIGLLWPESDPATARKNLRNLLWSIKRATGASLEVSRSSVALASWVSVDVWRLRRHIERIRAAAEDPALQLARASALRMLYQGPLLETISASGAAETDLWLLEQHEHLSTRSTQALQRALQTARLQHAWMQVLELAHAGLKFDPLNEELQRAVLEVHLLRGERTSGVRAYQRFAQLLQDELHLEPAAETQSLYAQLLEPRSDQGLAAAADSGSAGAPARARLRLPVYRTSLWGREQLLSQVQAALQTDQRLITIHGSGGVGKTRLAVELSQWAMQHFSGGVVFLALDSVSDPAMLPLLLINTLNLPLNDDHELLTVIAAALREQQLLLIFDNAEHLHVAVAELVDALLARTSAPRVLVTSREPLHIAGEQVITLCPLDYPQTADDPALRSYAAVRCFVDRWRSGGGQPIGADGWPVVQRICQRLQGIPLALELAASWGRLLTLVEVDQRLDDQLKLLHTPTTTGLQRHQSMLDTVRWSYQLLEPAEQELLQVLSCFSGGWTVASATAVALALGWQEYAALAQLQSLLNKSLIYTHSVERQQYRLQMFEVVRAFVRQELAANLRMPQITAAVCDYFVRLAEDSTLQLRQIRISVERWNVLLSALEAEIDNFRCTLHALVDRQALDQALRLSIALESLWFYGSYWIEGRQWLQHCLDLADALEPELRAHSLYVLSRFTNRLNQPMATLAILQESLQLYQALENEVYICRVLVRMGHTYDQLLELEQARTAFETALAIIEGCAPGDEKDALLSESLKGLANILHDPQDAALAVHYYTRYLAISRKLQNQRAIAGGLNNLAYMELFIGDSQRAVVMLEESVALARASRYEYLEHLAQINLAAAYLRLGMVDQAARLGHVVLRWAYRLHDKDLIVCSLDRLAHVVATQGEVERAIKLLAATTELRQQWLLQRDAYDRIEAQPFLDLLHASVAEQRFAELWQEGEQLDLPTLYALALADDSRMPDVQPSAIY